MITVTLTHNSEPWILKLRQFDVVSFSYSEPFTTRRENTFWAYLFPSSWPVTITCQKALKTTNGHAWCRFLPLTGKLEVATIWSYFLGILKVIFYEATEECASIAAAGFVPPRINSSLCSPRSVIHGVDFWPWPGNWKSTRFELTAMACSEPSAMSLENILRPYWCPCIHGVHFCPEPGNLRSNESRWTSSAYSDPALNRRLNKLPAYSFLRSWPVTKLMKS